MTRLLLNSNNDTVMSKLEELIQKYCPDGVEWQKIEDICKVITPPYKLKTDEYQSQGRYPIIDQGQQIIAGFTDNETAVLEAREYVLYGDHTCIVKYHKGSFAQGADGLKILLSPNNSPKYVFYALSAFNLTSTEYKRHWTQAKEIEIPIPPLPVQEEIVRVLDTFTELQAELQAELQKRLQQYEYYKWSILESLSCPTKHITDIALIKARVGWQRLTTAEYLSSGDYYLITGTDFKNGQIDFGNCVFVSKERYEMDPNIIVGKGDILITKDGTLGKVAYLADEPDKPTTLNSGVFRIHITDKNVSPRYLFHYFTSKYFTDFVNSVKTGSTIPHLTQQGLVSLDIPIPSLEKQNRVVSILDRFETLTNDLTAGLPAEIEKRRQQYEYYRDQLLTFKRAN